MRVPLILRGRTPAEETSMLEETAQALLPRGKGILAADESFGTLKKRFDTYGIPDSEEMRRKWRELLFAAPGIERGLSGVILFDETIRQTTAGGVPFAEYLSGRGILPGIKVDQRTSPMRESPGEEVTNGLEGLPERLAEYATLGAKFTKWRSVIRIGEGLPSKACIAENARRLAQYARDSQQAGLVPILEPEVLLEGAHTLARSEEVLIRVFTAVFEAAGRAGIALSGALLKSSMALPGKNSGDIASLSAVAEATLRAFFNSVPHEVAGIVFLSGGQTSEEATARLNEIAREARKRHVPWCISFSFSRALQEPVMASWLGRDENAGRAQELFARRVWETAAASEGAYGE